MHSNCAQDAELAELRRIRTLAADLVRLDAVRHRAIMTGTGRELQDAAHAYVVAWEALKAAVTPPHRSELADAMGGAVAAFGGGR